MGELDPVIESSMLLSEAGVLWHEAMLSATRGPAVLRSWVGDNVKLSCWIW